MRYRCNRDTFTQEEFDQYRKGFYPMPSEWSEPGNTLFHTWRAGGSGAIGLLPVLGQFAHARFRHHAVVPKEKLARLAGMDPATIATAGKALDQLGLATPSTGSYRGKRVTTWDLKPSMVVGYRGQRLSPEYFHFSAETIYGGQWAKLTKVQRAIYLAVGGKARFIKEWDAVGRLVSATVPRAVNLGDIAAAYRHDPLRLGVRIADMSYAEFGEITGISLSALKRAINLLKHPAHWAGCGNDPALLRYSPLAVYPTFEGHSLLYHFRDHVPAWPWDILNAHRADIMGHTLEGTDHVFES